MTTHATATFDLKTWDEKTWDGQPWDQVPGAKLTHAITTKTYHGDIQGESTSQSLTTYREDGSATFIGLEQIVGQLNGRSGSFVLQSSGTYADGVVKTTGAIVPGSGTGQLSDLRGVMGFASGEAEHYSITLDYDFE